MLLGDTSVPIKRLLSYTSDLTHRTSPTTNPIFLVPCLCPFLSSPISVHTVETFGIHKYSKGNKTSDLVNNIDLKDENKEMYLQNLYREHITGIYSN